MTLLTHSKGPWQRVEYTLRDEPKVVIYDRDGRDMAVMRSLNVCDIALVEQAPEVLKALRAIVWDYVILCNAHGQNPNMSRAYKRARRAMEQAAPMAKANDEG